ncbi:hypothetical protein BCO18175_03528 [Burkholderia contaminans]|uniref:hypothetical protein n=1 Tax=Burkholderia contaminans TaxID=488447 RepID=UPI00145492DA|nr:hypothetical protein [Burkholderia contaminans]VWC93202.1 hypothetical protein BCO18175_03528 [Burkholderia contaminans]
MSARRSRNDDAGPAYKGKVRRRPVLKLYLQLLSCWTGIVACALYTTVVGWLAALDFGSSVPLQWALMLWGATFGWIVAEAFYEWQLHLAARLYCEDIADGVCPDRGMQMTSANAWKWYRRQGSPWWISSKRARPDTHPVDAIARLECRNPPPRNAQRDKCDLR